VLRRLVRLRSLRLAGAAALGYALGGISSADLLARRASDGRIDLREWGSRNPGAMNALRIFGPRTGFTVAGADVVKAAVACRLGQRLAGGAGAHVGGVAAVVGHCYPARQGWQGGKGVATSGGQCLGAFPVYFPLDLAIGITATALAGPGRAGGQRALVATAVPAVCWILAGLVWWRCDWPNGWGPRPTAALPLANAISTAVVASRFAIAIRRGHPDDLGPAA
jgi:glycerol-3-phosphate acyltransferase PlsY